MGANAQTTVPTFTVSQVLTADQMNQSARTGVPVFASTGTRDAAFDGAGEKTLAEGQICYIEAAPKRLQIYNGTAWLDYDAEYTSFTPTWTNYTRGNGTTVAKYQRIGKTIIGWVTETLGTTSSIGGSIQLTLPVTMASTGSCWVNVSWRDTGTNHFAGGTTNVSTTNVECWVVSTGGTYGSIAFTSATVPFTWGNTDQIIVNFNYEAA